MIAYESRHWFPKTSNGFIKILREILVYLIVESIVCAAIIVFLTNIDFHKLYSIAKDPDYAKFNWFRGHCLLCHFGPCYAIDFSFDLYLLLDRHRSKCKPIAETLNFFRKNMYIFELYLQTEERNAKKYNASIRLFENFIGCILLYGLMFTLFSQKTHTHANYIFGLQVYISYLCKNVFHMA